LLNLPQRAAIEADGKLTFVTSKGKGAAMRKTLIIAATGAVLAVGGTTAAVAAVTTSSPSPSVTAPRASTAIDEAAARTIATATVPGGTVSETALVAIQGSTVWKVHVATATTRQEVFVDATDGRILSTDRYRHGGHDDGPYHDLGDDHGGHH
jgi:uncharacterized membrane protein YkoI